MRILFLSRWLPYPANNGSKLRIYNLLRGLSGQHQVTLLSFIDPSETLAKDSCLYALCERVETVTRKTFNPNSWEAKRGFFSATPRWATDTFSQEMKGWIIRLLSEEKFDLVIASQIDMAVYSPYFGKVPALFEELEVGIFYDSFIRTKHPWKRFRRKLTWTKHYYYLARLLPRFRACTVVSSREREIISKMIPGYSWIEVIPNCIDLSDFSIVDSNPQPSTLIFTGSLSYNPNYDAMKWFITEIYPRIQSAVPQVCLVITGDSAGRPLPPAQNVELTGMVEEVKPLIAASTVSLTPIRFGGGTRLKILEAMALQIPVVSTTKGAEGLEVQQDENILLADAPEPFAEAVVGLLKNKERRQQIGNQGFKLVSAKYDWRVVMPHFLDLVERVVVDGKREIL